MRLYLRYTASALLALGCAFPAYAQEAPILFGQQELAAFKAAVTAVAGAPDPSLTKEFVQDAWKVKLRYPKNWSTTVKKKTTTKLEVEFVEQLNENSSDESPYVRLRAIQRPKAVSLADIDPYFDQLANLKPSESLSDWYIPSMGALERSDVTMAGQPGRQFLFASDRGGAYIGVMRIVAIDKTLYTLTMFQPAKSAATVYPIFDAMSRDLRIGIAAAASKKSSSSTSSKAASTKKISSKKSASSARRGSQSSSRSSVKPARARR